MNFKFNLSLLSVSDLALTQKNSEGFACRIIISYCGNSKVDINQVNRLNVNDSDIEINNYSCRFT